MDFFSTIPLELIAASVAKTLFLVFLVVLPLVSYTVYAERRVSAAQAAAAAWREGRVLRRRARTSGSEWQE